MSNHNQFRTLNGITAVIWTFLKLQTSILTFGTKLLFLWIWIQFQIQPVSKQYAIRTYVRNVLWKLFTSVNVWWDAWFVMKTEHVICFFNVHCSLVQRYLMRVWGNFGCNSLHFWFKWFTLEIETFFYLVRHCGYCFLPLLEGQEARLAPHHSHWLYGSKRSKSFQILGTGISHLGLDPDRRYFGVFNHTHPS